MKLLFERHVPGLSARIAEAPDVARAPIDGRYLRKSPLRLPEVSEPELDRHFAQLNAQTFSVSRGFYPLGSCTMKYNPKVNEEAAALKGFTGVHPLQSEASVQGCLEALYAAQQWLLPLTGMDAMSFQPAAGAHGEFAGLLLIRAYHAARGDHGRTEILIPDSAHGTNPASAAMAGYDVRPVPSNARGRVDLQALREAVGDRTAGLMLTNPNTLGLFEEDITEITRIVHEAGGINYYDGANLNAIMGVARPGDMGFDVLHLNLHKTFSTPHGGGGPGSGPVLCKEILKDFLPSPVVEVYEGGYRFAVPKATIGRVRAFHGNFLVVLKALAYCLSLGFDGLKAACEDAVLNANYLKALLEPFLPSAQEGPCMHEFVVSAKAYKAECGVSAKDICKALIDEGMHPPTMYFPLTVEEALMIEPTETESREVLDRACEAIKRVLGRARTDPESLMNAPATTMVSRPDETLAARKPVIIYPFDR